MNIEEKIIDYLHNELSETERQEVSRLIETDDMAKSLYEDYKSLFNQVQEEPLVNPDQEWVRTFSQSLKETKVTESEVRKMQPRSIIIKLAAAAAILLMCILGYNGLQQNHHITDIEDEVYALREMLKSDLNNTSVSSRIKAVRYSEDVDTQDEEFIRILEKTMHEDDSPHVRLAAVEALKKWSDLFFVQESLLTALKNEKDAHVKILLIETLSSTKNTNVGPQLDDLINDEESPQYIKDEAHKGIFKFAKNQNIL